MLREKMSDEGWSVEEIQKEQLYFLGPNGVPIAMFHYGTNIPYYAIELANAIYGQQIDELNQQLSKWTAQQGSGKRTSRKILDNQENIAKWRAEGVSIRQIAKRIGMSEGAVRHFLKNQ